MERGSRGKGEGKGEDSRRRGGADSLERDGTHSFRHQVGETGRKGYDSDAFVQTIMAQGSQAVIPPRSYRLNPRDFDLAFPNQFGEI